MKTTNTPVPEVCIGINTAKELPALIRKYGTKPLLVHGHRPVEDGLLESVRVLLSQAGIPHADMGQILPNPKFESVVRGVRVAKENDCDIILSLGGGSTLQCAKGIAYGMKYKGKDLWNLWKGKEDPKGAMTVAAVLTNPASGDELNNICTLVQDGKQKTLVSDYGICRFAILDPTLSLLPRYPTMNQVFSIFSYVFVRYLNSTTPQEEELDTQLLKDMMSCTDALDTSIYDLNAREMLFQTGYKAHTIKQKGDPLLSKTVSALAYHHSLPRGVATSAIFFAWLELQRNDKKEKMLSLAKSLFEIEEEDENKAIDKLIKKVRLFTEKANLPTCIPQTGLVFTKKELKQFAGSKQEYRLLKKANKLPAGAEIDPQQSESAAKPASPKCPEQPEPAEKPEKAKKDKKDKKHKKGKKDKKSRKNPQAQPEPSPQPDPEPKQDEKVKVSQPVPAEQPAQPEQPQQPEQPEEASAAASQPEEQPESGSQAE